MVAVVYPLSILTNFGLPKRISKGLRFTLDRFLILMYMRTIVTTLTHVSPGFSPIRFLLPLHKMCFIARTAFSWNFPISGLFQSAEPLLLLLHPVWTLGRPLPIWSTCPQIPNHFPFPSHGNSSMKSICAVWDT